MAALSPSSNLEAPQSPVAVPVQKKILQDVLDCIVHLKTTFFESHQPITDDSVILQRFCAKLEHLIQIGMKEKTSLLGRKKDYWDYFCECLASAKGSNDGIRYVKNLVENKTSLGKGRAFIRFCLVHQRLADSLQQCVSHNKTVDWFTPTSVLLTDGDCQKLVNSLYDLNAMNFDLSPRGYDLDTAWPSFSNRKPVPGGSWNVPLSRRSSVTSMDTVSQISISVDNGDVDRLTKDLEVAQNAKSELIGRIDALRQEKEQVSQSAWATHGELQAMQEQLRQLQSQHSSLQERYKELDISHMKLKLEKDHAEKFLRDEIKILKEKFSEEESKRVSQLQSEEDIWKKEVREEGERWKREMDRLQKDLEWKMKETEVEKKKASEQNLALRRVITDFNVTSDSEEDFKESLMKLTQHMRALQQELTNLAAEKECIQTKLLGEQSEKEVSLMHLENQLLETEKALSESQIALKDTQEILESLNSKVSSSELVIKAEREISDSLRMKESSLEASLMEQESLLKVAQDEFINASKEIAKIEEMKNELMKERDELQFSLGGIERQNDELKCELEKRDAELKLLRSDKDKREEMVNELSKIIENSSSQLKDRDVKLESLTEVLEKKKEEVLALRQSSEGQATDLEKLLQKKDHALDESAKQLEIVRKEVEEARNENSLIAKKLSASEEEVSNWKNKFCEIEGKVVNLEKEKDERIQEVQMKDTVVREVEMELDKLKSELASTKESLVLTIFKFDNLQAEQTKSEIEKEDLQQEIKKMLVEKESLKRDVEIEKNRIMGLLQESEEVKRSEGEEQVRVTSLIVEIEQLRKEKEEIITGLEKQANNLAAENTEKNTVISGLNSEVQTLKSWLENEQLSKSEMIGHKESEFQKLSLLKSESDVVFKNMIARLESEAEEVKQIHENETASYSERIKSLESQLTEKEKALAVKCLDYENTIEGLKNDLDSLAKTSSEGAAATNKLTSEMTSLLEERNHLLTQMDAASKDAEEVKSQLLESSQNLTSACTQLESVTENKNSLLSELMSMSEELTKVQNEKEAFERNINELKNSLKVAEDEVQEKLSEKRKVEQELEDLKDHFNKVVAENMELGIRLEGYQSQTQFSTKVLEENLVEAKDTVECLKIELMELQEKYELAIEEKEDTKDSLEKMVEAKRELSDQIKSLKEESDNTDGSEVSRLNEELKEEKQKHLSAVESLNEEISALQFQLSAEQMIYHDTTQTKENNNETTKELKTQVSHMEVIIEELERELDLLRKSKDVDSNQAKSSILQVQEFKKQLQTKQEEFNILEQNFIQINSQLMEETSRRERIEIDNNLLRSSYIQDVDERDLEIKNLKSDNEQIKKKLVKLVKDKDTLWHKTDELVTEQKRMMGDRWQDNERVTHCPQCNTEFSLFLRKHHCRVCGRIFCWSCSDFWMDSPYSSKKVRACKLCFNHGSRLGTADLSTSMVDLESDDDDDDGDDDPATRNGSEVREEKSRLDNRNYAEDGVMSSTPSQTNEGHTSQRTDAALSPTTMPEFDDHEEESRGIDGAANRGSSSEGDKSEDSLFQILDQEAVLKSISSYNDPIPASSIPSHITSSMLLLADDLHSGEVNRHNEVWIKPRKSYIVPVNIKQQNTLLLWEFSSQPKDIVFSVSYRTNELAALDEAEEVVSPCKCDSHKQMVRGELMAKQAGIYTLMFDNSYSKATSKKVHYCLEYRKVI